MTREQGDEPTTQPRGLRGRLRDILDRSIAMYLLRRVSGRPSRTDGGASLPPDLSVDEAPTVGATPTPSPIVVPTPPPDPTPTPTPDPTPTP